MPKRRLAVLAASAMLLMSFSFPSHTVQAAHRTAGYHSMQQTSPKAQYFWSLHEGGCHQQDAQAYNPADD
jgi:hypothetical protein